MQFPTLIIQYFVLIARTEKMVLVSFLVTTGLIFGASETFSVSNPQLDLALRSITKSSAPHIIQTAGKLTWHKNTKRHFFERTKVGE